MSRSHVGDSSISYQTMPRRRAAQFAASKISDITDEEMEQTVKKGKSSRSCKAAEGNPTTRKSSRQKKTNENHKETKKSENLVPALGPGDRNPTSRKKACEEFQKKGETVVKKAGSRGGAKKKVDNSGCQEDARKSEKNKLESRGRSLLEDARNAGSIASNGPPRERRKRTKQIKTKPEAAQNTGAHHKEVENGNGEPRRQETRARNRKKAGENEQKAAELKDMNIQTTALKMGGRKSKIKQTQGLFSLKPEDQTDDIEQKIKSIRSQISQWWQKCFFGAERKQLFLPYYDENWTTSNLLVHKKEEARLGKYYQKNRNIFENISLQQNEENKSATTDDLYQRLQSLENEYQHKLTEKDKKITELENRVQEMKAQQQSTLQLQTEKDEDLTALPNSLEKLNRTFTKDNDDNDLENSNRYSRVTEDFHEVNVLHDFCQKQKNTIRGLQREIEQLRDKMKQTNEFSDVM